MDISLGNYWRPKALQNKSNIAISVLDVKMFAKGFAISILIVMFQNFLLWSPIGPKRKTIYFRFEENI